MKDFIAEFDIEYSQAGKDELGLDEFVNLIKADYSASIADAIAITAPTIAPVGPNPAAS